MSGREICDEQIAPLVKQIDAIVKQHGFSYVAAFQYAPGEVSASCALKPSSDKSLVDAWKVLDAAIVWEQSEQDPFALDRRLLGE